MSAADMDPQGGPRQAGQARLPLAGLAAELAWLLALLGVVFVLTSIALRRPLQLQLALGAEPIPLLLHDVYPSEHSAFLGTDFRWSGPQPRLEIPGAGRGATLVQLDLCQSGTRLHQAMLLQPAAVSLPPLPGCRQLRLLAPPGAIAADTGNLALELQVETELVRGRDLGLALLELRASGLRPGAPPWALLGSWCLLAGLLWLTLRCSGLTARVAALAALAAAGPLSWLWGPARPLLALSLAPALRCAAAACAGALLLRWLTRRWEPGPWLAAARACAVLLFAVRLWGMQHPLFIVIDHVLRTHQVEAMANGQAAAVQAQLSRQYEWTPEAPVPYPLLSYWLLVPLSWLWGETAALRLAIEVLVCALEALLPLLLYRLLRLDGWSARSGGLSALAYAVLPVGFITFHDGSYPTIMGLVVVTGWAWLVLRFDQQLRRWPVALAIVAGLALALLMYATHLLFVPGLVGLWIALLWLRGGPEQRGLARALLWLALAALLLAGLAYYGRYIEVLLTQTLPSMWQRLRSQGSIGRDPALLPPQLLARSIPEHLWAHLRYLPALWALCSLPLLWRRRSPGALLILAWLLLLAGLALLDLRFGLWNKHVYFATPAIAMAAGIGLDLLWARRWGRLVGAAGLLFVGLSALSAWAARVLYYSWPRGSF